MVLRLLIDAVHEDETRVVIADGNRIHDFDFVTAAKKQVKGNIYLAKITRVEPSLQAAFVEYGSGKQGFLPFAEIHPDYYQIPTADRQRLMEEAEEADEDGDEHAPSPSPAEAASEAAELKADTAPAEHAATEDHAHHDAVDDAAPQALSADFLHAPVEHAPEEPAPAMAESADAPAVHSEPVAADAPAAEASHAEHAESGEAQEIETLASDEDAVRQSRPASFQRRYKIQEVIKRNQIVLVQVIKEERGNKGVSLTTFISLAGRYCVLMPNSPKGGGISRKIMSGDDRKRLKEISAELKTARGMSAIIRTAGIDRTRAEIKRDYEYLVKLWESIREQTLSSTAPALIYEEGDLLKRTIRDLYSAEMEEIIVAGEDSCNRAKDFLKMILPSHAPRVKLYEGSVPLFYAYNIEDQLASMYDPIVKLRSGGYIVINPTEALISIDVNSGRSTGERNIEETASKTNLEAAAEIARQLRLRDLAGLIVIDFIDMMDSRNRRNVERALKDALKLDRAKIQIGRISPFGLLEMSRQRLRPSISETSSMPCPHCLGKGMIRSDASVTIQIIRAMEKEAASGQFSDLRLTVTPSVALHLLNTRREAITSLEQKYSVHVQVQADTTLAQGIFRLEKIKGAQKRGNGNNPEPVSLDQKLMDEMPPLDVNLSPEDNEILVPRESTSPSSSFPREDRPRRGRRGGRGRNSRDFNDRGPSDRNNGDRNNNDRHHDRSAEAAPAVEGAAPVEGAPVSQEGGEQRPRGERGGRGRGRRYRDRRGGRGENGGERNGAENGAAAGGQNNGGERAPREYREPRNHQAPAASSVPPLSQQTSADAAPKKGWWRRIVE